MYPVCLSKPPRGKFKKKGGGDNDFFPVFSRIYMRVLNWVNQTRKRIMTFWRKFWGEDFCSQSKFQTKLGLYILLFFFFFSLSLSVIVLLILFFLTSRKIKMEKRVWGHYCRKVLHTGTGEKETPGLPMGRGLYIHRYRYYHIKH